MATLIQSKNPENEAINIDNVISISKHRILNDTAPAIYFNGALLYWQYLTDEDRDEEYELLITRLSSSIKTKKGK